MSTYIDAIVIPVPRANLDSYKRMSAEWGNAHLRLGAGPRRIGTLILTPALADGA